MAADCSRKIPC